LETKPHKPFASRHRPVLLTLWVVAVAATLYLFVFQRDAVQHELQTAMSTSMFAAGFIYLMLSSLRGFTLLPAAPLLLLGIAFFPPFALFVLTLTGILCSAAVTYWFSESLHLEEIFTKRHALAMTRLKSLLQYRELPVIIAWGIFPLTPTDLIVYVCGVLRVDFKKCLLGVAIGAGANCAVVIFLGDYLLRFFGLKV
jgi:uncharacterized membrane protein YdjX (TVP38/TMEM64 family)